MNLEEDAERNANIMFFNLQVYFSVLQASHMKIYQGYDLNGYMHKNIDLYQ